MPQAGDITYPYQANLSLFKANGLHSLAKKGHRQAVVRSSKRTTQKAGMNSHAGLFCKNCASTDYLICKAIPRGFTHKIIQNNLMAMFRTNCFTKIIHIFAFKADLTMPQGYAVHIAQ